MRTVELNHFLSHTHTFAWETQALTTTYHTGHPDEPIYLSVSTSRWIILLRGKASQTAKQCLHQTGLLINNRRQTLSCFPAVQQALKWVLSSWGGVKVPFTDYCKKQKPAEYRVYMGSKKCTSQLLHPPNSVTKRLLLLLVLIVTVGLRQARRNTSTAVEHKSFRHNTMATIQCNLINSPALSSTSMKLLLFQFLLCASAIW